MNTQEILKPIAGDFLGWYNKTYHEKETKFKSVKLFFACKFFEEHEDKQLGVLLHYFREREIIIVPDIKNYFHVVWQGKTKLEHFKTESGIHFNEGFKQAITKAVELVKGEA